MWLTLILRNWQVLAIAGLSCALALSTSLGLMWKAERNEQIALIDSMKKEAENFRSRSEKIARQINEHSEALVESAKKDAYKNYLAKYGRNAACGVRLPTGVSQTNNASGSDGTEPAGLPITQDFLDRASKAAVMIDACQRFAIENELEVQ